MLPSGQQFKVGRLSDPGTVVGAIVCADEDDSSSLNPDWGVLLYAITGGNANSTFLLTDTILSVNAVSYELGQISLIFSLTIRASDRGGLSSLTTVLVTVIDANKNPVVSGCFVSLYLVTCSLAWCAHHHFHHP